MKHLKRNFKEISQNEPITRFKRNKHRQEINRTFLIENGRAKKDSTPLKKDKCTLCRSKAGITYCKQMKTTS